MSIYTKLFNKPKKKIKQTENKMIFTSPKHEEKYYRTLYDVLNSLQLEREYQARHQAKQTLYNMMHSDNIKALSERYTFIILDIINHDYIGTINDIERNRTHLKDVLKVADYLLSIGDIRAIHEQINNFKSYVLEYRSNY